MTTVQRSEPAANGLAVRVDGLGVTFPGGTQALRDASLDVEPGSFTAVIGPNGCGKSTLLRVLAGLLSPTIGNVALGDTPPRPGDGRVSLAFQQPRLVPWLSALDNVALPLTLHGVANGERRRRAEEALERVGLTDAAQRTPRELSGGMQQRAALARALITDPPLLLLDEPFSALDALTREAFDAELQRLWLDRPRTVILVTHSVSEAIALADRIVVMTARPGRVAREVRVDLPRPRSTAGATRHAVEIEAAVRETLASVHPAELAPWVTA
ncbi:MAG TPA: ABC transporter ATP-binding protein [Candidatus Limnocylindria bacterium]|nr:ABC transporter ATP-binding protein [Candidatus Limnocylindria bacterium]